MERVDREYANLIAAATGTATEDHPVFRMCLSLILSPFLARRRLLDDWLATAESGLDASREVGDPHMEAGASINLAGALIGCRQYRRAADVYQQSASAYRKIGHKDGEGAALSGVGASLIAMAEFEDALPILRRAVAVLRRSGDRQEFGTALISLGRAWAGVGEFDVAVDTAQQAVDTLREAGDRHAEGEALFALGKVLHEAGRGERSVDVLRQAVTAFQETDDAQMEEVARNYIDLVHVEGAQEGGVSDAFLTTFTAGIEIGDANSTAGDTLMLRGAVLLKAGRVGQAAEFLREAVSVFRETGPRLNEGDASALLGVSLMVANEWRDTEAAMAALESAIVIYQELGEVQRASLAHGCVRLIHGARHMEKREWDEAFDVLLDVLDRRTSSGRKPGRAWRRLFRSRKK
ncbi:hypothetical protein GCM10010129_82380 [Streptomyces fumigatiscleroticus]|nr:hypothetical protein GCM10010129_82380 [Streptomyces fumigatiscleroticus]